jgi:hypothetical protein
MRYRGRSQPTKDIALLAEGVSDSQRTYKRYTTGCSLTEVSVKERVARHLK